MNEIPHSADLSNNGYSMIELLYKVDTMLRDELKSACEQNRSLEMRYLLEARVNVNQAIEAIYDKKSHDYCQ
jgi:hypothetical protein